MKIPGEKGIEYKTSRISHIHNYLLTIMLIFFLTLILPFFDLSSSLSQLITLAIFLVSLALVFEPETQKILERYLITNAEVVKIEGLIIKKSIAIPYQSVADVRVIKGVAGRILNFGNIVVKGMKDDILMKGIRDPDVVCRVIQNKIALMKRGPIKKGAKIEKAD